MWIVVRKSASWRWRSATTPWYKNPSTPLLFLPNHHVVFIPPERALFRSSASTLHIILDQHMRATMAIHHSCLASAVFNNSLMIDMLARLYTQHISCPATRPILHIFSLGPAHHSLGVMPVVPHIPHLSMEHFLNAFVQIIITVSTLEHRSLSVSFPICSTLDV